MQTTILAFETAMSACSVCVARGPQVLAHHFEPMARGQAEALIPTIASALNEAGAAMADVDLVATTVGPGTFTGVRIALATARGLALARDVPVLGLTTTEVVAAQHGTDEPVLVVLETKRADYYVQVFGAGGALADAPRALTAREILHALPACDLVAIGDGADRLLEELGNAVAGLRRVGRADTADAATVARLAVARLRDGVDPGTATVPQPLYLRAPDVRVPAA